MQCQPECSGNTKLAELDWANGTGFLELVLCSGLDKDKTGLFLFFNDFIYLFLERGEGKEKEGEREKYQCVVASRATPTRDPARNPGTCLTGNQLVTLWFTTQAQSTELYQPGQGWTFSTVGQKDETLKTRGQPSISRPIPPMCGSPEMLFSGLCEKTLFPPQTLWWTFELFPPFGYCKYCCYEHS